MESRIFLVVCILLSLTQLTFSEDNILWCNLLQEHSKNVGNGQSISLRFNLGDPFDDTQSLVWEKGDHYLVCEKLNNRSLNCSTDESPNPGRYKLTQLNGTSFGMFIAFTEQNDSGQHIVKIQQGTQSLCTIVMLNLTVEGGTPICSATVSQQSRKLQMSCEWVHVNEGDRARLLAGNQVVYEYETPKVNFRRDLNLSNKITAYVAPYDIFNEHILPSECVITNSKYKMKRRRGCRFPKILAHQLRKVLNQNEVFECGKFVEASAISWWYSSGDFLLPVNATEERLLGDDYQIVLICGEEHDDLKTFHNIWRVQFQEHQRCNTFVSAKGLNSSEITIACVNKSESTPSSVSMEEDNGTACNKISKDPITKLPLNDTTSNIALYSLAALSSVALTFSLCGCFAKCCRTFFRKRRYRLKEELDQGTLNARNNEVADSVDINVLSVQTPQTHRQFEATQSAPSPCLSVENNRCANQDTSHPDSDLPDRPPTLPSRRHLVKWGKKCCDKTTVKQLTGDNVCNTNIVRKNHTGADSSTASNHDSTYCSVDDVQGTMTGIKGSDSKLFLSSLPTSMTSGDYHGNYDFFNQKKSSPPSADPDKRNLLSNSDHSDHTANPESVYALPDMSRKTKRMTSVESDYDDPRPPGEEYFQKFSLKGIAWSHPS